MNQLYFYNIQFIKLGRKKQLNMEEILKFNVLILNIVNQCWARGTAAAAQWAWMAAHLYRSERKPLIND